jgi:hypothetical protein
MQRRIAQLGGVMRRDRGRHADSDALRAVGEQIGKGRRQHHRLVVAAVICRTEIHGILVDAVDQYPRDPDLRQEYLRAYIPSLVRGQATPEVAEVAAAIEGPPALLLKAASQGASGDLRSVVSADAGLAEITWRDAWYPEALEMRVDWRTRVSNPDLTRRFGDEALPMIDRMIIMTPTLMLLKVRAEAGLAAQRPSVVVESLSSYVRLSTDMVRLGQLRGEALKNDATSVRAFLDRAAAMPGADATRIEEVRAEVAAMEATS